MSSPRPVQPPSLIAPERLEALDQLLDGLDATSLGFIAGYVTARARTPVASAEPVARASPQRRVTVLYASQTGNGRRLAEKLGRQAEDAGVPARVLSTADYPVRELSTEQVLILFISTHGDGDPPDDARGLLDFLTSRRAPRLDQLAYGVFALGDSSYPKFCETGRVVDARLAELGARKLLVRAEADGEPQSVASDWLADALAKCRSELGTDAATTRPLRLVTNPPSLPTPDAPLEVEVLANQPITGRGATREVRHIELALPAGALTYQPGDSLGVWPHNPPETVSRIIALIGATGEETIGIGDRQLSLSAWLSNEREITRLTRPFLEAHARRSGTPSLLAALQPGQTERLRMLLTTMQVVDVLSEHPANWAPQELVEALRPLSPRLYSIASSQASVGDEVHLTVAVLDEPRNGIVRPGAASGFLARDAVEGERVRVYVEPNIRFRLPRDHQQDVIMIGPGTGVAPFRSFVQERSQHSGAGRSWLFFGARHFDSEFLYQIEWQEHLKRGHLTRMDVAFSRDQDNKIYVQHRLLERASEVWRWLNGGAAVYVCGDAEFMAPDVHSALRTIVATQSNRSEAQAEEYLSEMVSAKRYLRDVY